MELCVLVCHLNPHLRELCKAGDEIHKSKYIQAGKCPQDRPRKVRSLVLRRQQCCNLEGTTYAARERLRVADRTAARLRHAATVVSWQPMAQTDSGVSVRERVIRVLAETQHIEPSTIQPESTFEALGIDSFDGINILFAIESEFDISVPDDEAKKLRGVQDIIDGVEKLLNARASAATQ